MISDVVARNDYVGDGSTLAFIYSFQIADQTALEVLLDGVVQTLSTHYTVSGVGNPTGTVTFVNAPALNVAITILRKQPTSQGSDYLPNEAVPAERIEKDLDKLVMRLQQVLETIGRAFKFTKKSLKKDENVDDPTAGRFLRAKNPGPGFDWAVPTEAGGLTSPVTIADGGTGATTVAAARGNIFDPIFDAKGDLVAASAADTAVRVPVGANRTILESDSVQVAGVIFTARALGLKSMQVFTASGTWTRPTGIRRVLMEVVGGGGGGGSLVNGAAAGVSAGAGGGGGGGTAIKLLDVSAITTSTITIGAGGAVQAVGVQSSWADGVNTVVGAGGGAGVAGDDNVSAPGGAGGAGSGGNFNIIGGPGGSGNGAPTTGISGHGGSSHIGGGAPGVAGNANGVAATANTGGGGSGGLDHGLATARTGGAGGSGIVIVFEYE